MVFHYELLLFTENTSLKTTAISLKYFYFQCFIEKIGFSLERESKITNYRMVKVDRGVWRLLCPTVLLKQGCLGQFSQVHVQTAFEYLQRWRLHNLSRQPVPVLGHPHSEKAFPDIQRKHLVSVCALCLWSCHWAGLKRAWLHPLCTHPSGIYLP